jgi:hypothetical protein
MQTRAPSTRPARDSPGVGVRRIAAVGMAVATRRNMLFFKCAASAGRTAPSPRSVELDETHMRHVDYDALQPVRSCAATTLR